MRTTIAVLAAAVLVGTATSVEAQRVVTSYPPNVPVTTYYAPAAPAVGVTTYYPPAPAYATAAPVVTYYAPAAPAAVYYAPVARRTYVVRPKVYVRGQPVRNVLRAITP